MVGTLEKHITDPNATLGGKFQIAGKTAANKAVVEANTRALRTTLRSNTDARSATFKGAFIVSSNTTALGSVSAELIFGFVWQNLFSYAVIRKVLVGYAYFAGAATAGVCALTMTRASVYTTPPSTGTKTIMSPVPVGTLRSTNYEPQAIAYITTDVTGLSGATKTADTNPIGSIQVSCAPGAGTGVNLIPPNTPIYEARPGEPALTFQAYQGFDINLTCPLNGNKLISVTVYWEEYVINGIDIT